jgi:hypothetical protein
MDPNFGELTRIFIETSGLVYRFYLSPQLIIWW